MEHPLVIQSSNGTIVAQKGAIATVPTRTNQISHRGVGLAVSLLRFGCSWVQFLFPGKISAGEREALCSAVTEMATSLACDNEIFRCKIDMRSEVSVYSLLMEKKFK